MNKRGIGLTLEIIVIAVLALSTLIIMLAMFTNVFSDIAFKLKNFPTLEIEPTNIEPITYAPTLFQRGTKNKMSIGFLNLEADDIGESVLPRLQCNGASGLQIEAMGINVPVGSVGRYKVLVKVPKEVKPDRYACKIIISQTEKSVFQEIR